MDEGIEMDVIAVLNHVHALEKTLICNDCNEIMKDPVIIGRCGHTFCQTCVAKYAGKHCPTCKVPVDIKDSHEDKQLCDLLQAVAQLKLLLNEGNIESKIENGPISNVEGSAEICKTPLCSKSSTNEITVATELVSRAQRVRKRTKCRATDCHCSPKGCLTPKKPQVFTPVNTVIRRRTAMTSPIVRKVKRPSFRFCAFSAGKNFPNKLRSPRQNSVLSSLSNVEKKNAKGETALHVAVIKGDVDRVKILLMKKANPNVKDNAGWTPLHEASNHGYFRIAELLVRHGAEINAVGPENIAPLHDAIMNEKSEVAKFLASKGADINARTVDGYSAIDLCKSESLKSAIRKVHSEWKKSKVEVKNSNVDKMSPEVSIKIENVKVVLLPSCLVEASKQILQKCASDILQGEIVTDFTPTVTHIITCLDDGQCIRTLKILCGILSGKWILDFKWIDACLKHEKRIPEEEFEAAGTRQLPNTQGPKRARLNMMQKLPPLFHGCHFYTYGTFNSPSPSKTEIHQLIQMGGGKVLAREPKPETAKQEKFVAPYHITDGILSDISYFILYQEKPPRQIPMCDSHICTVSIDWFINSICSFELLEPSF